MRATKTQTQRSGYRRRCPGATPLTRSGLPFEGKDHSGSCAWRMDGRMGERGEETEGASVDQARWRLGQAWRQWRTKEGDSFERDFGGGTDRTY